ncbi:hypothetical protein [Streptomyces graminilatus]|uniref:hypothetical protein n=1 Tax=Streptomyces graminilatus TaxID=1464070 RepID=UPI000A8D034F|nr:hypothetical protein [Streptomyces graminilatus]
MAHEGVEARREINDEVLSHALGRPDHGVAVSLRDSMATRDGAPEHGVPETLRS